MRPHGSSEEEDLKLNRPSSYSSFFLPAQAFHAQSGQAISNDSAVSHQLRKVLRLKNGDGVRLLDGLGNAWAATIVEIERERTVFKLVEALNASGDHKTKKRCRVVSLLPMIKSHRFELALEKLTEIGVDQIMPFATTRTIVKIKDDNQSRLKRWQLIVKEAAEQSERLTLPTLTAPSSLEQALQNIDATNINTYAYNYRLLLSERSEAPDMVHLLSHQHKPADNHTFSATAHAHGAQVVLIVGPEGGFTEDERNLIMQNNFLPVSMGDTILRSETAAILSAGMAMAIAPTLD